MKLLHVLALMLLLILCSCRPCSDEVRSQVQSPDAVLTASSFTRNCGATVDFSTIVSIHRPSDTFRDTNNFVFVAKGPHALDVSWTGPKTLKIRCSGCARAEVFRQVQALGDIDIGYELVPKSQ